MSKELGELSSPEIAWQVSTVPGDFVDCGTLGVALFSPQSVLLRSSRHSIDSVSEFASSGNVVLSLEPPLSSLSLSLSRARALSLSVCLTSFARACERVDGTKVLLQAARSSSSLLSDTDSDESEPSNNALYTSSLNPRCEADALNSFPRILGACSVVNNATFCVALYDGSNPAEKIRILLRRTVAKKLRGLIMMMLMILFYCFFFLRERERERDRDEPLLPNVLL